MDNAVVTALEQCLAKSTDSLMIKRIKNGKVKGISLMLFDDCTVTGNNDKTEYKVTVNDKMVVVNKVSETDMRINVCGTEYDIGNARVKITIEKGLGTVISIVTQDGDTTT